MLVSLVQSCFLVQILALLRLYSVILFFVQLLFTKWQIRLFKSKLPVRIEDFYNIAGYTSWLEPLFHFFHDFLKLFICYQSIQAILYFLPSLLGDFCFLNAQHLLLRGGLNPDLSLRGAAKVRARKYTHARASADTGDRAHASTGLGGCRGASTWALTTGDK